jgi:hypothetical protein
MLSYGSAYNIHDEAREAVPYLDPLFNHAKADAPPTGLAERGFAVPGRFSSFSPDMDRAKEGAGAPIVASLSSFRFPSSKKRD